MITPGLIDWGYFSWNNFKNNIENCKMVIENGWFGTPLEFNANWQKIITKISMN